MCVYDMTWFFISTFILKIFGVVWVDIFGYNVQSIATFNVGHFYYSILLPFLPGIGVALQRCTSKIYSVMLSVGTNPSFKCG